MKNIKYIGFLLGILFLVSSCEKTVNTAEESATTYLPKMSLNGSSHIDVPCGDSYSDPGIVVTEGGVSLEHQVAVSGNYFGGTSVEGADDYVVAYSAVNVDSIPGSAFRTITVVPCNNGTPGDLSGVYTASCLRSNGEGYDVANFFIVRTGTNTFAMSDAVGGFYDLGRGYGPDYACKGSIITVNDIGSNDISVSTGEFPVWGNTVDISGFTKHDDGTISFDSLADFGGEWSTVLTPL